MGTGPGNYNKKDEYVCKCGASFRLKFTYRKHKKSCENTSKTTANKSYANLYTNLDIPSPKDLNTNYSNNYNKTTDHEHNDTSVTGCIKK